MSVYGWLLAALGAISLIWSYSERRFHRDVLGLRSRKEEGADPELIWRQQMALLRQYDRLNWAVAWSILAIFIGFALVGFGYYSSLRR